jgi:SnoaL-like domain
MLRSAAILGFLAVLTLSAPTAWAEGWNPAATVAAYTAALSHNDVDAGLALFDENGSATDLTGHTYSGHDGLREFLRNNGFGSPNVRVTTDKLLVVANRAFWNYSCSCASGATEVRIVLNDQDKISVFAMFPLQAARSTGGSGGTPIWLLGVALVGAAAAGVTWRKCAAPQHLPRRAAQGRLLAGLREAHVRGSSGVLSEPAPHLGG